MKRLAFSLSELRIAMPMSPASLSVVLHEVVRRNRVRWGIVYLQITRGVSRRDHAFPPAGTAPAIVVTARNLDLAGGGEDGRRRRRRHLGAGKPLGARRYQIGVAPAQRAGEAGGARAGRPRSLVRRSRGARDRRLVIERLDRHPRRQGGHPAGRSRILEGITRTVLLEAIAAQGLKLEERAFTLDEAYAAREAFITSASQIVLAGGQDRRPAGRQRRAWVWSRRRCGATSTDTPKSHECAKPWHKKHECSKSTRICAVAPPTWACT